MMWARVVELMLGLWLIISPFVFRHSPDEVIMWVADFSAGTLIVLFALLSCWKPTRHAHRLTAIVAVGMVVYGRLFQFDEPPAALQNHIVVGLLLVMFALIPNHASEPPANWYAHERSEI